MTSILSPTPVDPAPPRPSAAIGLGVLAIAMWSLIGLVVGAAWLMTSDRPAPRASGPAAAVVQTQRPDLPVSSGAGERPERLRVPRIGVDTHLMDLDLTATRQLQVPPLSQPWTAGWYDRSPVPGDIGPAVLAGHVDSRTGPAVFYRLRELRRGDRIVVDRSDGRTATFAVDRVEQVEKAAFPTRRVYGATPRPELRLITCGGSFDAASGHYTANVVVYAHLSSLTAA